MRSIESNSVIDIGEGPIQGQLLRLSARREVAIYLRGGQLWVADFIDGHGELVDPETWFRFNCASPDTRPAAMCGRSSVVSWYLPPDGTTLNRNGA